MNKGIIVGIIIIVIISGLTLTYTNFLDIIKSKKETVTKTTKNTTLKVEDKDIVEKTEIESDKNKMSNFLETDIHELQIDLKQTKFSGIAYSPYRKDQSPLTNIHPTLDEIENDIKLLSAVTDKIRIYGIAGNNKHIPEIAEKYGLKTAITLLLTGDKTDYDKIERAVQMANKYDGIYTIIVENEGLYRETLIEEQIIQYLNKTRENLNPKCTITIAEPVRNWLEHPEIAKHVDYVMINYYPYFSGIDISNASNKVSEEYRNVKESLGKEVVIGETGWPSDGRAIGLAVPSPNNQQKFISEFRKIAYFNGIEYFFFEAFDEKWKLGEQSDPDWQNNVENNWGLFFENGTIKESLKNTIPLTQKITTRN
ncbi:MAG: glycosyl hydrolase family 17 protein [Nitrosopumilus sp.]|nr:glycosyl hydrolase family 17 protein [Nitrosopumilus sp.]MDH5658853.1 glycosyl hydrolase family 17 protein [Nitrosopumilus sp.]